MAGVEGKTFGWVEPRRWRGMFRRQHPFGSNIVDFYCHQKHLAIEIDGVVHLGEDARERDKIRQEIIEKYGVHFLRLSADEVEHDLKGALAKIKEAADETPHP